MTRTLKTFVLIAVGTLLLGAAHAQTRIATVDLSKVFAGYWKTKEAESALKLRDADLRKELDGLKDEFEKFREDYKKLIAAANDQALSSEEREKRKKSAETKLKQLKEKEDDIKAFSARGETAILEQKKRSIEGIMKDIDAVISAKGRTGGYSLVLNTSPEGIKSVLYTNGDNDLTDAVIQQLNINAPTEISKPAEKK